LTKIPQISVFSQFFWSQSLFDISYAHAKRK
jgi:hypothetical protein